MAQSNVDKTKDEIKTIIIQSAGKAWTDTREDQEFADWISEKIAGLKESRTIALKNNDQDELEMLDLEKNALLEAIELHSYGSNIEQSNTRINTIKTISSTILRSMYSVALSSL